MTRVTLLVASVMLAVATPVTIAGAQNDAPKSRGAGVYLGGGFDGASIVVFGDPNVEESGGGGGISLGTGLNAHVTPAVAVSGAVMWTLGVFDQFQSGDRTFDGSSVVAGTTRVHLGLVWFPKR